MLNKEEMKKLLELNEPILVTKFAPLLKPFAKIVYLVGLIILAISVLSALVSLLTGGISAALIILIATCVEFVLLRMFCEFLVSHQ